MSKVELYSGDCLVEMDKLIERGVKVDAIITDPPYGTTACKWDSIIPFEPMWERLNKLIKTNGAIVLFGSEPFSSALRMSNIKNYKYDWVWEKSKPSNFLNCKKQPMRKYENVSVFYYKQCCYNPQGLVYGEFNNNRPSKDKKVKGGYIYGEEKQIGFSKAKGYPTNKLKFSNPNNNLSHPTQKPVALMEYLIKTYTNENETILDFTMGSGSTGVACKNLDRNFIGVELDKGYFEIAKERINET